MKANTISKSKEKATSRSMRNSVWDTILKPTTERHWTVKRRKSKLVWKSKNISPCKY
jgi:hypothetical protein